MEITDGLGALRPTVRRDLINSLEKLASKDVARRSAAALAVSRIMRERELTWDMIIIRASRDGAGAEDVTGVWPAPCMRLLDHPAVSAEDRAALRRLAQWKAPGRQGLAMLARIAARVDEVAGCGPDSAPGSGRYGSGWSPLEESP